MSSDTAKHHELLSALKEARGKADGSFEQAVTDAFEHVFEHLDRLNTHVSAGGPKVKSARSSPMSLQPFAD